MLQNVFHLVAICLGTLDFQQLTKFQYTMTMIRETRRCRKILDMFRLGLLVFPDKWMILVIVGALGGKKSYTFCRNGRPL